MGIPVWLQETVAVVGMFSVVVALVQFAIKLRQDHLESRRRQAQNTLDAVSAIYSDVKASRGLEMLDYNGRTFETESGRLRVEPSTIVVGLRTDDTGGLDNTDVAIRDTFDTLFRHLQTLSSMVDVGLAKWDDVDTFFGYYFGIMRAPMYAEVLSAFCGKYGYPGVKQIIDNRKSYVSRFANPHSWLE